MMTYTNTRWGLASLLAVLVAGGVSATVSRRPFGLSDRHDDLPSRQDVERLHRSSSRRTPTAPSCIDMNGRVVKQWPGLSGAAGGPARILPGGQVIGGTGSGLPHQEAPALVQLDWDGKEVWRFDHAEQIPGRDGAMVWSARQHHDWQRPGYAAGYFAPGVQPAITNTPTLRAHAQQPRQTADRRSSAGRRPADRGLVGWEDPVGLARERSRRRVRVLGRRAHA